MLNIFVKFVSLIYDVLVIIIVIIITDCSVTGGHKYKLFKRHSNVNAYKYFYTNRICDVWNSLPDLVVYAPSVTAFRCLLDRVDL